MIRQQPIAADDLLFGPRLNRRVSDIGKEKT
jgi:hypothetical protein